MGFEMMFRENIHWVALVSMAAASGWHFLACPWHLAASAAGVRASAGMIIPATIAIVVFAELARVGAQLHLDRRGC